MKNIGGTIRTLRQEKGITLPALAEKAQLSKGLLSKVETSAASNPSLDTLYKIAAALEVPLPFLLEPEQDQLKRIVPDKPPTWQKELLSSLKEKGKQPDKDILNALYVLRNRKAAKKADAETWKFLYQSIENSFKP
jgi:XRE family transcriptional regulator, master regulator for biofilm formation